MSDFEKSTLQNAPSAHFGPFLPFVRVYNILRFARARVLLHKMQKNAKKMQKNLRMSKKSSTFAPAFG